METEAIANKENVEGPSVRQQKKQQREAFLEKKIAAQAEKVRQLRDACAGPWREDSKAMEAVRELMLLKYLHPKFRHETLPEGETQTVLKLRWKVYVDGKAVTLQVPVRNKASVKGSFVWNIVRAQTAKKVKVSPIRKLVLVKEDVAQDVMSTVLPVPEEVTDDCTLYLPITFPGPKFQPVVVLRCVAVNDEQEKWAAGADERKAKYEQQQKEAAARKEAKLAAAAEAAKKDEGKGGNKKKKGRGRGRGRRAGRGRGRGQ